MYKEEWNDRGFRHLGKNGCEIIMAKKNGPTVLVKRRRDIPWIRVVADVAEAMAFHALHMYPEMQDRGVGFAGYDTLDYDYETKD